ncbi:hypothetical protein [Pseudomonas sp. 18175]|uniref:hypothetical protein n=1 Tax=Pseudomonas sp. 18175 TaxID=3390056 RepID=UPI003D24D9DF
MKGLFAVPFLALALTSFQANALCLYITESFTGIVEPGGTNTAHGPFSITPAGGCTGSNITATVTASGAGSAPRIFIERAVGGTWKRETFGTGPNLSYTGGFGTYRVMIQNQDALSKSYSGTVRYGR